MVTILLGNGITQQEFYEFKVEAPGNA